MVGLNKRIQRGGGSLSLYASLKTVRSKAQKDFLRWSVEKFNRWYTVYSIQYTIHESAEERLSINMLRLRRAGRVCVVAVVVCCWTAFTYLLTDLLFYLFIVNKFTLNNPANLRHRGMTNFK